MKRQVIKIAYSLADPAQQPVYELDRREQADGAEFHPHSFAKVCPTCLVVWAVATVEGETYHEIHGVSCATCNRPEYHAPIPGSLLDAKFRLSVDWDLLEDLTKDLAYREFQLHVKAALNEQPSTINIPGFEPVHIIKPGESSPVPATWGELSP